MTLVTVGTTHAFDRLIRWVDGAAARGLLGDEVVAQYGNGRYEPRHLRGVRFLTKGEFDEHVARAGRVISHAGMGVLTAALERCKPILVVARQRRYGEAVNDHQVALAEEFARAGHAVVARNEADFPGALEQLKTFVPQRREVDAAAVVARISCFLASIHT